MVAIAQRCVAAPPLAWIARGVLLLWLGFWGWFSIAEVAGGVTGAWMHLLVPLTPMVVLTVVAWLFPRVGGGLLIAGAALALFFFDDTTAWLALSGPALLAGGMLLAGARGHRAAGGVSVGR